MPERRFRLATVLRLRESARDECRARLAESLRADQALLDQITRLGVERNRVQSECRMAARPGNIDLGRLVDAHRYVVSLIAREESLHERRQSLAVEIQERREALVKADQDVQVLEKLRDRRRARERVEEERKEAKRIDEAALQAAIA
jgi:flagellar protein FliJ